MSYNFSKGSRKFGDITSELDDDTKIDFEEDYIGFKTGGSNRFVVSGSNVGIGTTEPSDLLTLDSSAPCIQFKESGANRSKIFINDSDNLVLQQQQTNKHIVLKINDAGTVREGMRLNGAVPEVVINEGSDALVDFRVESDNNTHMFYVDGGNNKVGINTNNPAHILDINGDTIRLRNQRTIPNSNTLGEPGEICYDANYLYICVGVDTWKRIPLDTW
tara:strand:- start:598 stop:1251 length:654 start_codon:yes stop_codon:yes gene_type:complete